MDYGRPELVDRLAADYAAGTLRGAARRRYDALLPAHPAMRAATAAWQARLMPLTAVVAPVTPPASVWIKVQQRLGFIGVPAVRPAWWQRLSVWRGWAALATVCAAALAVIVAVPEPVRPPVIVVLSAATPAAPSAESRSAGGISPATFVASISGDGRSAVTRPLVPVGLKADRSLELWALPAKGAPRSLGLIDATAPTVVARPDKLLRDTATLAVSLEPSGGSTTGAPTGPVLYVGKLPTGVL